MVTKMLIGVWLALPVGRGVSARLGGERGEGVISTAIAVLVMALIGLAMWQLFDQVFTDAGAEIQDNVNDIGG